ncbi:MAG TPA: hypothetical protein PLR25_21670, partial [Planctomycetaceae bacterium]|nr:hypothetical protein [Planctomycetaceae bacterium]
GLEILSHKKGWKETTRYGQSATELIHTEICSPLSVTSSKSDLGTWLHSYRRRVTISVLRSSSDVLNITR